MTHARTSCQFQALTVAMRAKTGQVAYTDILRLTTCCQALPGNDQLRLSCQSFIEIWRRDRRNTDAIYLAGTNLQRAVERATWPSASERADLDG